MKNNDLFCSLREDEQHKIEGAFSAYVGAISIGTVSVDRDRIDVSFRIRGTKKNILCLKEIEYIKCTGASSINSPTVKDTISSLIWYIIDFVSINHLKLNVPTSFLSSLKFAKGFKNADQKVDVYKLFMDKLVDKFMEPSKYRDREFVGIDTKLREASVYEWYKNNVTISTGYNNFAKDKDVSKVCKELRKTNKCCIQDLLQSKINGKTYIVINIRGLISYVNARENQQRELRKQMLDILYGAKNSELSSRQKKIADVMKYILKDKQLREKVIFAKDFSYSSLGMLLDSQGAHCSAYTCSDMFYLEDLSKKNLLKIARAAKEILFAIKPLSSVEQGNSEESNLIED